MIIYQNLEKSGSQAEKSGGERKEKATLKRLCFVGKNRSDDAVTFGEKGLIFHGKTLTSK